MKSFPQYTKYIIIFYFLFIIGSLCGYYIIEYRIISFLTIIVFTLYLLSLIIGSYIGYAIPLVKIRPLVKINLIKFLCILFILSFLFTIIGWYYVINHYGSLAYVFTHGTMIRDETIGNGIQLKPTLVSYLTSIGTIGIPISLAAYYFSKNKLFIFLTVLFFINTILVDLQSFGRIGMLFSIFTIIAYVVLCIKKIPYLKYLFYGCILLIIFMIPKFIRAGQTLEGIGNRYSPYLVINIPSAFEPILSVYAYYFSGIYAFDYLLDKGTEYSFGLRNFSAIYNLLNRIFEFQEGRNTIIAQVAYVPFDTNIYTLAGELFMDWGIWGICIGSICAGIFTAYFFRYKGVFGLSLKFVLLTWLFETPIYNIFSFGGFLICLLLLIILTTFCDAKIINNNRKL